MSNRHDSLRETIASLRKFRLCGPSDDPDEITGVVMGYHYLTQKLKMLAPPLLTVEQTRMLEAIAIEQNDIYSVYDATAVVDVLIDEIERALAQVDQDDSDAQPWRYLIHETTIENLRNIKNPTHSPALLIRLCQEANSCFSRGNVVAAALVLRAILNYVPPLFGQTNFQSVAAQCGKTLKESFTLLEDGLRKIADFHAHRVAGKGDYYPTVAQLEPFKPQIEQLLHEVSAKLAG